MSQVNNTPVRVTDIRCKLSKNIFSAKCHAIGFITDIMIQIRNATGLKCLFVFYVYFVRELRRRRVKSKCIIHSDEWGVN